MPSSTSSYHELKNQVSSLISTEKDLRQETSNLVKALRQPHSRGQWGEVILEKILEISGMIENVHYVKQQSGSIEDKLIRPDIIVNLPNGRNLIIDAKAVMSAYLDAMLDSHNDEKDRVYKDHANQLRSRINDLSKKEYYAQFQPCPEFVVLFLPAESLFSSASFNTRLLPSFRKLAVKVEKGQNEIEEIEQLDVSPRMLQAVLSEETN